MATGEKSGTWGTITNTNLELIGEALGYGTEDVPTDANATITMQDATSDGVRSMYLKITSSVSLTATRTVTLAPNTVSKVWIIENATTGSQSIAISQGSGSNVTIPTGSVRMIYTDGAGAGAAVTEIALLSTTGGTMTGNVDFNDNIKAIFGTGSDLEIYHDGSNSIINDAGTGDLQLQVGGSNKIEVTGTGATVTGTLAADALTVDTTTLVVDSTNNRVGIGEASPAVLLDLVDANPIIRITDSDTGVDTDISGANSSGSLYLDIDKNNTAASSNLQIDIDGSEVMRIDSSGNVGIGTSSPGCTLDVSNDAAAAANNEIARLRYTTSTTAGHSGDLNFASTAGTLLSRISSVIVDGSNVSLSFSTYESGTLSENFLMQNDGDFHADGDVIAYSTTISDERLKEDVKVVESALDKVKQLRGVTFKYKTDGKVSAGVIAQELEKVLPEAVSETELPLKADDGEKYKVVQYDALHALMIEAIKELSDEVARLKESK